MAQAKAKISTWKTATFVNMKNLENVGGDADLGWDDAEKMIHAHINEDPTTHVAEYFGKHYVTKGTFYKVYLYKATGNIHANPCHCQMLNQQAVVLDTGALKFKYTNGQIY